MKRNYDTERLSQIDLNLGEISVRLSKVEAANPVPISTPETQKMAAPPPWVNCNYDKGKYEKAVARRMKETGKDD